MGGVEGEQGGGSDRSPCSPSQGAAASVALPACPPLFPRLVCARSRQPGHHGALQAQGGGRGVCHAPRGGWQRAGAAPPLVQQLAPGGHGHGSG